MIFSSPSVVTATTAPTTICSDSNGSEYDCKPAVNKYFFFSKFTDKSTKKKDKDFSLSKLSMEERIIQKNIKTLLYESENLEPLSYTIKNKNMVLEIMNMI
jgi:hypothetical protein